LKEEKINILLADDDDDDREFFKSALQRFNTSCELTMVNNGQRLIQYLSDMISPPDYVFLDINMPLVDGIECLGFIKKKFPEHQFPIIMLSTAFSQDMINRCYAAGASVYIRKPNKFGELVDILRFCIHELKSAAVHQEVVLLKR
jgi:CheY-like chemotaxis protein